MKRFLLAGVTLLAFASMAVPAFAAACATTDVSLTIGGHTYNPTKCADNVANGNPTQETATMNSTLATTGFVFLAKSNDTTDHGLLGGVTFAVTAPTNDDSGTWHVSWAEAPGTPNLPLTMDIGVGLFGGNEGSDYLLTNVLFPTSPTSGTGTFDINFTVGRFGQSQPDLSHLTLTGGNVHAPVTPAPEPMSLALLGSGLLGLGVMTRKRAA